MATMNFCSLSAGTYVVLEFNLNAGYDYMADTDGPNDSCRIRGVLGLGEMLLKNDFLDERVPSK
jgi:hypothetical protein